MICTVCQKMQATLKTLKTRMVPSSDFVIHLSFLIICVPPQQVPQPLPSHPLPLPPLPSPTLQASSPPRLPPWPLLLRPLGGQGSSCGSEHYYYFVFSMLVKLNPEANVSDWIEHLTLTSTLFALTPHCAVRFDHLFSIGLVAASHTYNCWQGRKNIFINTPVQIE